LLQRRRQPHTQCGVAVDVMATHEALGSGPGTGVSEYTVPSCSMLALQRENTSGRTRRYDGHGPPGQCHSVRSTPRRRLGAAVDIEWQGAEKSAGRAPAIPRIGSVHERTLVSSPEMKPVLTEIGQVPLNKKNTEAAASQGRGSGWYSRRDAVPDRRG
jgi:hypothetical protein